MILFSLYMEYGGYGLVGGHKGACWDPGNAVFVCTEMAWVRASMKSPTAVRLRFVCFIVHVVSQFKIQIKSKSHHTFHLGLQCPWEGHFNLKTSAS